MSHLDDSLDYSFDEQDEAMSYVSTTFSETDVRSLSDGSGPGTPTLPISENLLLREVNKGQKHPKYYLSDFFTIQVESMLYRVPRAILQQCETLGSNLHSYKASGALYVNGITTQEMEAFLDVSDAREVTGDDHFTLEQWAGALVTADRLGIPRIRSYVTKRLNDSLNQLDPFDCIDVATKYRVHEWLFQPFLRICERPEPLSPAEILRLGSERAGAVWRVREKLFNHKYESAIAWITKELPSYSGGYYYGLQWDAMTKTLVTGRAVEAKRLIELETVLSKPNFQLPSPQSIADAVPQGMPHPKYWQTDLRTIKVRGCLYQLPIRYFEQPSLLGGIQSHGDSSVGPKRLRSFTSRRRGLRLEYFLGYFDCPSLRRAAIKP